MEKGICNRSRIPGNNPNSSLWINTHTQNNKKALFEYVLKGRVVLPVGEDDNMVLDNREKLNCLILIFLLFVDKRKSDSTSQKIHPRCRREMKVKIGNTVLRQHRIQLIQAAEAV